MWGFRWNEKHHKKTEKTEAKRLLFLLKKDVALNDNLLSELRKDFTINNYKVVYYNLSLVVWNSITPNIARVLRTDEIKDISEFYFQLQHITRKVDMIFQMTFMSKLTKNSEAKRQMLIDSLIQKHIPSIFDGTICSSPKTIIAKIECLMKELKD